MKKNDKHICFDELYERYKSMAYTTARRYLLEYDAAMDVVQDVFIKMNTILNKFKTVEDAGRYLMRMLINKSIDVLRRDKKQVAIADGQEFEAKRENGTEDKDEIDFLLSHLSEDQRMVVVLRELASYSVKESAEILEIDEGTVKSRLSRAKLKMKEIYLKKGL